MRRREFLRVRNGETLCGIGRPAESVSQKCPRAAGTDLHCRASEQGKIDYLAILANTTIREKGKEMKTLTAKDAKYGFGQLIDLARSAPVAVSKHGRPVVVVLAMEEFERLTALEHLAKSPHARTEKKERKK